MLASLNSRLYTVAALREISDRMGIAIPAKSLKADVAALIAAEVDRIHAEYVDSMDAIETDFAFLDDLESALIAEKHATALDMNDDFDSSATFTETDNGDFILVEDAATKNARAQVSGKRVRTGPLSYNERSISRALTYARQNGYTIAEDSDVYPAKHFTPKQRRRAAKKYNAQYAKLSAQLNK